MTWNCERMADLIRLGTKCLYQRTHKHWTLGRNSGYLGDDSNWLQDIRHAAALIGHFPFLKACRDSMKRPYSGLPCLIEHRKPSIGTDRSSAAGTNHTANLPLILFSSSPSHLSCKHSPLSTLSLISLPFDICPLKRCPVLVKPILPCLMYNIPLLFYPPNPASVLCRSIMHWINSHNID